MAMTLSEARYSGSPKIGPKLLQRREPLGEVITVEYDALSRT